MNRPRTAITFSRGIRRIPHLSSILNVARVHWRPPQLGWTLSATAACVVGWGGKANTAAARAHAQRRRLPYLTLEDGFLRSLDLGVRGSRPYSLVVDDLGIYYDATRPSRLEQLLNGAADTPLPIDPDTSRCAAALEDPQLLARARDCIAAITRARLSKYNAAPEWQLPATAGKRVLVVDQTAGDLSIAGGLADGSSFRRMLAAARSENPGAEILIKVHPEVVAGKKRGHFLPADLTERTRLLARDLNPIHLLEQVDRVYVVSSQMGMEALLLGKPVTCFGAPFYAGWGLTDDRVALPQRQRQRSLEALFAAAYLLYARYLDPDTGAPCAAERVIEHLALQRHWFAHNRGHFFGCGIAWWKRAYVRRYLASPWNRVQFVERAGAIPAGLDPAQTRVLVWGTRDTARLRRRAAACGYPVWRMEDGFLRSAGLGTDLTAPASQVIDRRGIYFDPAAPSDLEALLQEAEFSPTDLTRATALRQALISARLSKYNVGDRRPRLELSAAGGRTVILVPGQVEQDASIRLGSPEIRSNAQLLAAVRQEHPDAYILYKPHPDVLSGNRRRDTRPPDPAHFDRLVADLGIVPCLEAAQAVHTMTSLVGFEALLRGLPVHTYGQPFYAGWGLTQDRLPLPRRTRRLSLDQLVAGVLLLYPRYLNPATGEFTSPEMIVELLGRALATRAQRLAPWAGLQRPWRTGRAFVGGVSGELFAAWQTPVRSRHPWGRQDPA